jgi:hypothetical protein
LSSSLPWAACCRVSVSHTEVGRQGRRGQARDKVVDHVGGDIQNDQLLVGREPDAVRARHRDRRRFTARYCTPNAKLPGAMLSDLSALPLGGRHRIGDPLRARRSRETHVAPPRHRQTTDPDLQWGAQGLVQPVSEPRRRAGGRRLVDGGLAPARHGEARVTPRALPAGSALRHWWHRAAPDRPGCFQSTSRCSHSKLLDTRRLIDDADKPKFAGRTAPCPA